MTRTQRQRGAAILTAMLLVTLVAALSTAALWQQWRTLEVETAERQRTQASWILQGAVDWARLILREDARAGAIDHLAEPWAVPLQDAKLSAFLASHNDGGDSTLDALQSASLSGQISDLQARLNLLNLVQDGKPHAATLQAATRLFEALHLPPTELQLLVSQLQLALEPPDTPGSANRPHPLLPRSAEQLGWLGLSAVTVRALRPYVVVLPERTPLNLNTAPAVLLQASLGLDAAGAQRLVAARTLAPFQTLAAVVQVASVPGLVALDTLHSVNSRYFEVRARLRLGTLDTLERTVVQREGLLVKPLWKERVATEGASVQ